MQVYYDLAKGRQEKGMQDQIAIVRIEQLAPFPFDLVMREMRRYPNAEIMWYTLPPTLLCMSMQPHRAMYL